MKSLINRLFGRKSPPGDVANRSVAADVRAFIDREVAGGFCDEDEILVSAMEVFAEEMEASALRTAAQQMLRSALAAHRAAAREWPTHTDCDKLDAAFAALEADGVIARQNFTCCGTCGSAEIWDAIATFETTYGPARGYAFYHVQDTESAVEGGGLYLNYGAVEDGEAAALTIARDIVAELEAHGLQTDWNGSWNQRIGVALDWKRRRDALA